MTYPFEFDVFLSHSSLDKPTVRALAERLRQDGVRVWFDEWEIQPGDSIFSKVEYGLENARLLVLCMSQHAFNSDWATLEAQTARFRDPLNKNRRFLPLKLDNTPAKGTLAQFLYIDWRDQTDAEYEKLRQVCAPIAITTLPPGPLDFARLAQILPHRQGLTVSFVNALHETITQAKTASTRELCDDCILRIQTHRSGQLALFYQASDHTFVQLLPHKFTTPTTLTAGEYYLPGKLLDLSTAPLGPDVVRLYFTAPGHEAVLAVLSDTLPTELSAKDPLSSIANDTMRRLLQAFLDDTTAATAFSRISVVLVD